MNSGGAEPMCEVSCYVAHRIRLSCHGSARPPSLPGIKVVSFIAVGRLAFNYGAMDALKPPLQRERERTRST